MLRNAGIKRWPREQRECVETETGVSETPSKHRNIWFQPTSAVAVQRVYKLYRLMTTLRVRQRSLTRLVLNKLLFFNSFRFFDQLVYSCVFFLLEYFRISYTFVTRTKRYPVNPRVWFGPGKTIGSPTCIGTPIVATGFYTTESFDVSMERRRSPTHEPHRCVEYFEVSTARLYAYDHARFMGGTSTLKSELQSRVEKKKKKKPF